MYWISKSIHRVVRFQRRTLIFLAAMGPGIITMVADNDAGGISTYAQTGVKTGFNLLWAFIILVPMAYYVQEMTVRLGAVTKRGHAEAIFDGFGKFWGWFSIFDLALINWLTLVTEYIGMTQPCACSIFPNGSRSGSGANLKGSASGGNGLDDRTGLRTGTLQGSAFRPRDNCPVRAVVPDIQAQLP
jgi:hypothetical protein